MENLTPEKVENTIEQVRHGNIIDNVNQPAKKEERFDENENFTVESKEAIEEIKNEILEEFLKT